jgi:hypothetical protein
MRFRFFILSFVLFIVTLSSKSALPLKIDGRQFADNIALAIEATRQEFSIKIDRKKSFILAAHMFIGGSSEAIDFEKTPSGDVVIKWLDGEKSKGYHLYKWLMDQPKQSVMPHNFFLKALEICDGNVFEAINVGLDILIVGRHDGARRNYYTKTQKLVDIRGDAALLEQTHRPGDPSYRWTSKSDNFSAWYHFWATMIYAFFRQSSFTILPVPGHLAVFPMIFAEEFIVGPLEYFRKGEWKAFFDLRNRVFIDIQGALAGYRLAVNLSKLSQINKMSWNKLKRQHAPYLIKSEVNCEKLLEVRTHFLDQAR